MICYHNVFSSVKSTCDKLCGSDNIIFWVSDY